jgi:hypothetical protein
MTEEDKLNKLVKDMVEIALANNKILALGSFKSEDFETLDEAIKLNNYVLETYTDINDR